MAISLFAPNTPFADLIDRTAQSFDTARNAPAPASPTAPQLKSVFTQPAMDMSAILTADPSARQQIATEPSKLGFQSLDQAAQATSFTPAKLTGAGSTPAPVGSSGSGSPAFGFGPWGDASIAQRSGMTLPGMPGGTTSLGGDWSGVDQWNSAIQQAAAATGVDPNLIKAVMKLESNGDPNAAGAPGVWGPMQVNGNPDVWGDGPWMHDPVANILKGAQILKYYLDKNGGNVAEALRGYHGYAFDGYTTPDQYAQIVLGNYQQLQQAGVGRNTLPTVSPGDAVGPNNPAGLGVLNVALSYVGKAPYIWGSIPGKGQNPAQTGWDCSGMTYWLDQNYGSGRLPMGSHYQYQYAQQTGQLFTNLGQLQPGDLVFIDTGWQGGAGAELNRAGHVAVYLGNGKIVQAANETQGTIVSNLSSYQGQYGTVLGAMHMSWSGGAGGGYAVGSGNLSGIQRSLLYDFLHRQGQ